jgi:hypothetical protein
MLNKARERGYSVTMQNSNGTWYSLMHKEYPINLILYLETGEFELSHMVNGLRLTTDKCGSFANDKHFKGFERKMRSAILELHWEDSNE